MRLSIGMIVKNEERTLRDCLNSIKPLLEQVDSQLIIADTGSTDSTIAIAKEFTDNVYEIVWPNDFSAARNTTLDRAEGEWYMYIDADEIFQDVSEIAEFFNSGEYKRYESARHKRCDSLTKIIYEPVRLFKKHPDTKFISKIHEIIPDKKPQKRLASMSIHMDSRALGPWENKKKTARNISLLTEMYKEDPSDIRTVLHIVNEYFCCERLAEAREFIEIGLKQFEKNSLNIIYHYLSAVNTLCYYKMELYEKTVEAARDYVRTTKRSLSFIISVRIAEGDALSHLGRFDEADKAFKEALKQLERLEKGDIDDEDIMEGLSFVKIPNNKSYIVTAITTHCLRTGAFSQAFDISQNYNVNIKESASAYMTESYEEGFFDKIKMFYGYLTKTFSEDSEEYDMLVSAMEKAIPNEEIKNRLSDALLSSYPVDTDYLRLHSVRQKGLKSGALEYFINSEKRFSDIYGDIIVASIRNGVDFSDFADKIRISDMEWFTKHITALNSNIPFSSLLKENSWYTTCRSLKTLQIVYMLCEASLNADLFEPYILTYNNYLSKVYKDTVYCDEEIHGLPQRHSFVYYSAKGLACKDKGNLGGFVSNLRLAIKADNSMKDIVATVADKLQELTLSPQEQLKQEVITLKNTIISLIQNGQTDKARQLLAGFQQLMPSDPDIDRIKDMIGRV